MPKRVNATRTLNPLHFEDLEPHRFEDLVRRLLYDFREWRDLDPTGRSGSDEGFDIRAWDRIDLITNVNEEGEEGVHSSDGNLWQIQGKREKTISPAQMRAIIQHDIDEQNPPYGYILAAAANISKKAYDVFREQLKLKQVKEFYFWGKDYLEDQLARPNNDEILFTFFGISLSPRRRARTAEIKFGINNKNKMLKLLIENGVSVDGGAGVDKSILLRDVKDRSYPDKTQYADFDKHRRWEEFRAVRIEAKGVLFKTRERYAFLNPTTKQWDFTRAVDLLPRKREFDVVNDPNGQELAKKVEQFWRHLPRRRQAKFTAFGFVSYEDMLIIDDKGDPGFAMPHVFIDFSEQNGPFVGGLWELRPVYGEPVYSDELHDKYNKIALFPDKFPEPIQAKVHDLDLMSLTDAPLQRLSYPQYGGGVLFSFDGKFDFLSEGDLIRIKRTDHHSTDRYVEITHVRETTVAAYLEEDGSSEFLMNEMENYAGRNVTAQDQVTILEFIEVHKWGAYLTYDQG